MLKRPSLVPRPLLVGVTGKGLGTRLEKTIAVRVDNIHGHDSLLPRFSFIIESVDSILINKVGMARIVHICNTLQNQ